MKTSKLIFSLFFSASVALSLTGIVRATDTATIPAKVFVKSYDGNNSLIICKYGSPLTYNTSTHFMETDDINIVRSFAFSSTDNLTSNDASGSDLVLPLVYPGTNTGCGFELYAFHQATATACNLNISLEYKLKRVDGLLEEIPLDVSFTIPGGFTTVVHYYKFSLQNEVDEYLTNLTLPSAATAWSDSERSFVFATLSTAIPIGTISTSTVPTGVLYRKIYLQLYIPIGTVATSAGTTYQRTNAYRVTLI